MELGLGYECLEYRIERAYERRRKPHAKYLLSKSASKLNFFMQQNEHKQKKLCQLHGTSIAVQSRSELL